MIRTRVGYAGGRTRQPTYHEIGDHAEALQLDYDPRQITFAELLDLFFSSHRPTRPPWKRQYMSALFFHDGSQRRLIEERCARATAEWQEEVHVEILPAASFYRAEDYHQKFYLQRSAELMEELGAHYPDFAALVDSTAAARLNGFMGGARTHLLGAEDLSRYGLSETGQRILRKQSRNGRF